MSTPDPKALIEAAGKLTVFQVGIEGVRTIGQLVEALKESRIAEQFADAATELVRRQLSDALAENAALVEDGKLVRSLWKCQSDGNVELLKRAELAEANAAKLAEALRLYADDSSWRLNGKFDPNGSNFVGPSLAVAALAANPGSALLEELRALRAAGSSLRSIGDGFFTDEQRRAWDAALAAGGPQA